MTKRKFLYSTNTDSNDISVIDVKTRKEIKRIPIGGSPRGAVKFDKEKKFGYVSNCAGDTISKIDLNDNIEVAKIKIGFGGRAIVLSENEKFAFESIENSNSVVVIDIASKKTITKVEVGPNPRGMAIDNSSGELYVSCFERSEAGGFDKRNILTVVDVSNPKKPKSIASIQVGLGPCSVSLLDL